MPFRLINPDNRFLSWSTSDFSLYGGQPDPVVTQSLSAVQGGAEAQPHSASGQLAVPIPNEGDQPSVPMNDPANDSSGRENSGPANAVVPPHQATTADSGHGASPPIAEIAPSSSGVIQPIATQALHDGAALPSSADHVAEGAHSGDSFGLPIFVPPILDLLSHDENILTGALDGTQTLFDLAGSDPVAGLTTLTNLVSTAEVFDLREASLHSSDALLPVSADTAETGDDASALLGDTALHAADTAHGLDAHHILGGL